jgi:hypothetical protein
MAISGSGGWTPSVRVSVRNGKMKLGGPIHNVPKSATHLPLTALEKFIDNPKSYIYVAVADEGGTVELDRLLREHGIVYDSNDVGVGRFNDA